MAETHYQSEIIQILNKKGSIRAANLNAQVLLSQVGKINFKSFLQTSAVNSTYMLFPIKCNSRIIYIDVKLSAKLTAMNPAGAFKFFIANKPNNWNIEIDIPGAAITTTSTDTLYALNLSNSEVLWHLMAATFHVPTDPTKFEKFNSMKNQTNYYLGMKLTTQAQTITTTPTATISVQMTHASPSEMSLSSIGIPASNAG